MLKTFPQEVEPITGETVLVKPASLHDIHLFDRVVVRNSHNRHHLNFVGTVLDINSRGSVGIYWPAWEGGHRLDGHSPTGKGGWYYLWNDVLLVEDPEFDIPDNIASIMDELL